MRFTSLIAILTAVAALALRTHGAEEPGASLLGCLMNLESERAALMQTSRDWARAAAGGDFDLMLSFWSEDAIVMPPGQPAMIGKAAIGAFVRQTLAIPGFRITWEPEQASVANDGDVGYMIERNCISFTDATGVARVQFGKAVTVWCKDSTGAWKCVVDTWNENPTERALPAQDSSHQEQSASPPSL